MLNRWPVDLSHLIHTELQRAGYPGALGAALFKETTTTTGFFPQRLIDQELKCQALWIS
jgi:hypothetical protein